VTVIKVGISFLMTCMEVVMVERLRVSIIMLAKPIKMVIIIPRDIMPPVRVRYYI